MAERNNKRKLHETKFLYDSDSEYEDEKSRNEWVFKNGKVILPDGVMIINENDINLNCIDQGDRDFILKIMQITSLLRNELDGNVRITVCIEKDVTTSEILHYFVNVSFSNITRINNNDLNAIVVTNPYRLFFPDIYINDQNRLTVTWKICTHKLTSFHSRTSWLITYYENTNRVFPLIQNNEDGYQLFRRKRKKAKKNL
jgi:hypothetical protein